MAADSLHAQAGGPAGILEQAEAWPVELRARAGEIEAARKLPQDIADRFAADGFYTLCNPRDYGGSVGTPRDYALVVETLARGDASAGWCAFIAITAAYGMATVKSDTVRSLLSQPGVITAGVFAPMGRACVVERGGTAGYIVNGRWAWGSGLQNAHWVSGGCFLADEDGAITPDAKGRPQHLSPIFAADQIEFIDTWTVSGLQGTGSTDFAVTDVFVPADRVIHNLDTARDDDPIFRFPAFGLLGVGIAAVALGTARGAMEDFGDLLAKVPDGSRSSLGEKSSTHRDVARAEVAIRQGRAFFLEAIDAAWEAAKAGAVPVEQRRDLRLATTAAVRSARDAVDIIYELAGGSAVYRTSPIQRRFRDVHVATQHMMVSRSTYELTGRLLLGQPTDTSML